MREEKSESGIRCLHPMVVGAMVILLSATALSETPASQGDGEARGANSQALQELDEAIAAWERSRYVVRGGEVHDRKTRLTWQRCSAGQVWVEETGCVGAVATLSWQQAVKEAPKGWRLPHSRELMTLVDPQGERRPAIDAEIFPGTTDDNPYYWVQDGGDTKGCVHLYKGLLSDYLSARCAEDDVGAVRWVRSGS